MIQYKWLDSLSREEIVKRVELLEESLVKAKLQIASLSEPRISSIEACCEDPDVQWVCQNCGAHIGSEEDVSAGNWLSIVTTGKHSGTYIFVVGVYESREKAQEAAELVMEKEADLYKRYREAEGLEGYGEGSESYELEMEIQKEHERLFGQVGGWFPPRPADEWRIEVRILCGKLVRIF